MKHKMLIVDDEPANLRMLERLFRADQDILTATSGAEALELLSLHDVALIISDQRMPGMTGIEFLKRAALLRPQTVRIILTGYTDVGDVVDAINSGVIYKYITKPWVNTDLAQNVQRAVEYYESNRTQHLLGQENKHLESRLEMTLHGFVGALKAMIAQKNSSLSEHCRRTADYAAQIGEQMDLAPEDIEQLIFASLLHELPNMRIPFKMDLDKAALTVEQLAATRSNYENGLRLFEGVPDFQDVAMIIRYQHEHVDGTGYFEGLAAERIPLRSRILAVANAFDELISSLNPAFNLTDDQAADSLRKRAGTEFDANVVEAFLHIRLGETNPHPSAAIMTESTRSFVSAVL